tara:strand:+ start:155 stop:892 length:738 start_codon:yes stop_codon:yes gene_type:complete
MKYSLYLLIFFILSCVPNYNNFETKKPFLSKGFAYIYNDQDYENKIIRKKLDKNSLSIAHNKLRVGSLIKITNIYTNDSIILKNTKRIKYPDFYKIMITKPVAEKLNLNLDQPLVEIIEIKKNKSFIAKKTKIFKEEEKIHNNAPVELVKIDNISKSKKIKKSEKKRKFSIIIGEFYSRDSAKNLKQRITQEMPNFDSRKLFINSTKANKTTLIAGPYKSINLMKNDYIQLKLFGFEELDIDINE